MKSYLVDVWRRICELPSWWLKALSVFSILVLISLGLASLVGAAICCPITLVILAVTGFSAYGSIFLLKVLYDIY